MHMAIKHKDGTLEHVGLVLEVFQENYFMDSYDQIFCAKVWDSAKKAPVKVVYGSTHPGDTEQSQCEIDATPQVKAEYQAYLDECRANRERQRAYEEARTVRKGKDVIVIRGRKVPIGTVARVFWVGDTKYGKSVGLEHVSGKREFTALHNVKVLLADEQFKQDLNEILKKD